MKAIDVDRAIELVNRQIEGIEIEQKALLSPKKRGTKRSPMAMSKMTSQVMTMARGLATYQAELRKTDEAVDDQVKRLTPERVAKLALKLVRQLSPEHRAAVALYIKELDGKLISHG